MNKITLTGVCKQLRVMRQMGLSIAAFDWKDVAVYRSDRKYFVKVLRKEFNVKRCVHGFIVCFY